MAVGKKTGTTHGRDMKSGPVVLVLSSLYGDGKRVANCRRCGFECMAAKTPQTLDYIYHSHTDFRYSSTTFSV